MKTLVKTINVLFIALLLPVVAFAQLTVPQGGTGVTSVTANRILYGNSSLRLGSEAAFTYDASTNTLTADTGAFTSLSVGLISNTELGYLNNVSSNIQTQLDGKQATLGDDDITPSMVLSTGLTDEYCLSYEATGTTWEWKDCSGGGGGDNISVDGGAVVDPDFVSTGDIDFVNTTNTITADINAGSIVNADINASAAIGYSKLSLTGSILETDLSTDVVAADGDFLQYDSTGTNFTWRDAGEVRSDLGLVIGTNVQAYDADLTTYAGITPSANVQSLLGAADYAAMRSQLTLVVGTNVQAYDADLAAIAALAVTDGNFIVGNGSTWVVESGATARTSLGLGSLATLSTINDSNWSGTDLAVANGGTGASDASTARTNLGLAIGTNVQAYDADLTTYAGITPSANVQSYLGAADYAAMRSLLSLGSIALLSTIDISANTNLTAGRSLTLTGNDVAADAELYTDSKTIYFESPTASDDFKTIWVAPTGVTITSISCESDQTVNFDLQIDDGTPTGVNGSDIACTTFATDSSLAGDTTAASGDRIDLAVASVSGTPTWVSITFAYTKDD